MSKKLILSIVNINNEKHIDKVYKLSDQEFSFLVDLNKVTDAAYDLSLQNHISDKLVGMMDTCQHQYIYDLMKLKFNFDWKQIEQFEFKSIPSEIFLTVYVNF